MDKSGPRNVGASVRDRLKNLARETNEDFNRLLVRFALERLLYRLGRSEHSEHFVVKGAMMFTAWMPADMSHRPTKDLDLLGHGSADERRLERIFQDVCSIAVEQDDGIVFEPNTVRVSSIMPQQKYRGVRVDFRATIAGARANLQVDVGFGGGVSPAPALTIFPTLLPFEQPQMMAYRRETSIAEKFQAMVELGIGNGRLKDFFDIYVLAQNFEFDANLLWRAIEDTFTRRATDIPAKAPLALTSDFADDSHIKQWASFVKNIRSENLASLNLLEVIDAIREFLWALCERSKLGPPQGRWGPSGPWTFGS